jgi:hypothetical protein
MVTERLSAEDREILDRVGRAARKETFNQIANLFRAAPQIRGETREQYARRIRCMEKAHMRKAATDARLAEQKAKNLVEKEMHQIAASRKTQVAAARLEKSKARKKPVPRKGRR